jgi:hypothetical protein
MGFKGTVAGFIEHLPGGKSYVQAHRLRRTQRDWTTSHRSKFGKSSVSVFTTIGIGDAMIANQFCEAFLQYCQERGDPNLGHIVVTAGAWPPHFQPVRGDHNVYWWWSMSGREDWLDYYVNTICVQPDVIACLSSWCSTYAQRLGFKTLDLPLAVGPHFMPLSARRSGVGYGGSKSHKDMNQIETIIGPFVNDPTFEWVDHLKTPQDLNAFYNRKQLILGMTETHQERTGMVNNRVFEVLATGTPFIVHGHRALTEILGFEYPYQSRDPKETRRLAEHILRCYSEALDQFELYRQRIKDSHTYQNRITTLIGFLKSRN